MILIVTALVVLVVLDLLALRFGTDSRDGRRQWP